MDNIIHLSGIDWVGTSFGFLMRRKQPVFCSALKPELQCCFPYLKESSELWVSFLKWQIFAQLRFFFQGKLWQNTYYWKIRTCVVMLWTRYYPGTWILFQDLLKKPHFFLWLSFWQKKPHCKIQAFFVISFFCYFVTPFFTYMNSAVLRRKYRCSQPTVWAGWLENTAGWHLSWAVGLIYCKWAN